MAEGRNLELELHRIFIVHVGTNDVGRPSVDIRQDFLDLLHTIWHKKADLKVVLLCILPRPRDHQAIRQQVMSVNDWLRYWDPWEGVTLIVPINFLCLGTWVSIMGYSQMVGISIHRD